MATKFFTNEDSNTLLNKLDGVFKNNPQLAQFDALVGYFRSTGYFKLSPFLKNVTKIRILVGINVDAVTSEYKSKGLQLQFSGDVERTKREYLNELEREVEDADYALEIEESVRRFIDDIAKGRIQIKAHPSRRLHAKIYIFRPDNFNRHSSCEVITGSSNLTEAGLGVDGSVSNYEFNVSLKDYDDVKFATAEFEKLWNEAVDILPTEVEEAKNRTFLWDKFTPFELYIKLLIEYFGPEIEFNPENIKDLPSGFKRLSYQLDAVNQGSEILKKHNGFFLADVVGLGKTVVAILIARQHHFFGSTSDHISRTLIVLPPALKTQWEDTVRRFGMQHRVDYITNGSLHKINHPEDYDLVIVDEAHRFRNDDTLGYENLQQICKTKCEDGRDKKVILISATPLNNHPDDIRNQVLLFQDSNASTLEINIGEFFARIGKRYRVLSKTETTSAIKEVARLYAEVRNKVIEPLTVRRTRTDLIENESYDKDLKEQGIVFPEVKTPEKLLYPLNTSLNQLYDETVEYICGPSGLNYMRYRAIEFMRPEHAKDYSRPEFFSKLLAGLMKSLLIKRLDSSFFAFHQTLKRFVRASEAMLKMVANNKIIIAPNHRVEDYVLEDNEDELIEKLIDEEETEPGFRILSKEDFEPEFFDGLKHDHAIMTKMEDGWRQVIEREEDPKLETFLSILDTALLSKTKNPEGKLVLFSESLDTTNYLNEKLASQGHTDILSVNATNRTDLQPKIIENFDADIPLERQKSEYNIIITTEVLAEGVNLHRSNSILNYDTPWNSTRLMQRIGRINRIGTKASKLHVYNFFPTEEVESDIQLRKKAIVKLQAFHSALGEDSQIYSADERVETFGLFDKAPQGDDEINERLKYLMEIRKYREESPDDFKRIKNMPLKLRNAVTNQARKGSTISFLRNELHQAFYEVDESESITELSFLEAVPFFKCDPSVMSQGLPETHYFQVRQALRHFLENQEKRAAEAHQNQHLTAQQIRAISYLKALQSWEHIDSHEKKELADAMDSIKDGRFQALPRDINRLHRRARTAQLAIAVQLRSALDVVRRFTTSSHDNEPRNLAGNDTQDRKQRYAGTPKIIIAQTYV
ncbi:MAG: helicase-related protein [Candidatus Poribacteria bacterium]|nr:helicase-related protein [Candidatus Poribacteria bacterium]